MKTSGALDAQIGSETLQYTYTYDNLGQITQWYDPVAVVYHQYRYDVQNQFEWEQIGRAGAPHWHTFTNTYDTYGNIRSRTHRNERTGATRTVTLTCGNTQWRDLLTAININGGTTNITYDGDTGSPRNWHGTLSFAWAHGRQLQRVTRPDGLDVRFTYDHIGVQCIRPMDVAYIAWAYGADILSRETE